MTLPVPTIDHVVVNARDALDDAAETWTRLGFHLTPRGHHTLGSVNHLAMFGTDYLELIGVPAGGTARLDLLDWPTGLNAVVFGSEDAAATHAALAAAGVAAEAPIAFSRPVALPEGTRDASFRTVNLPRDTSPAGRFYFCEHRTRDLVWRDAWRRHRNGVVGIVSVLVAAREPEQLSATLRGLFGHEAVSAITHGVRLAAGLASVDVIERSALESRFGNALPADDGRAAALVGLVLRTASIARAGSTLRDGGIGNVIEESGQLIVPASAASGTLLWLRG